MRSSSDRQDGMHGKQADQKHDQFIAYLELSDPSCCLEQHDPVSTGLRSNSVGKGAIMPSLGSTHVTQMEKRKDSMELARRISSM